MTIGLPFRHPNGDVAKGIDRPQVLVQEAAVVTLADPPGTLGRALAGDSEAIRSLVAAFTPVIQARAARALTRSGKAGGRDLRQELADLVQDVLLMLFKDDGKVLRSWRADGGLSLASFVGLVAEREIGHIARSGRRSPFALDPADDRELEVVAPRVESAEAEVGSRDLFDRVYERLQGELSETALYLFRMLVVEELPTQEVCSVTGLSADAVYAWRSRLLRRAREVITELSRLPDSAPSAPIPERSVSR
jgi:RNA polymerase sigma-70 factor (ECF subfamily)